MRNLFIGYIRKSEEDLKAIWKKALFCFDTNVLLDLYRYSENTRNELLNIIGEYQDRIFIPHQVAFEFHRNRLNTIIEQRVPYQQVTNEYADILKKITNKSVHPHFSLEVFNLANQLNELLNRECQEANERIKVQLDNDTVFDHICNLFEGRVGAPLEDNKKVDSEAELRYKLKTPPGYKDAKKEDKGYGDYYVWKQMIVKSNADKRPMIFVTGETKVDWWWYSGDIEDKNHGVKLGPRPELVDEFVRETQQDFHIYSTESFMEFGTLDLNRKDLAPEVLQEVKEVRSEITNNAHNKMIYDAMLKAQLNAGFTSISDAVASYKSTVDRISFKVSEMMTPEQRMILSSLGQPMTKSIIQLMLKNAAGIDLPESQDEIADESAEPVVAVDSE